jgi:hypothetical protein
VWPDTHVGEAVLKVNMSQLRRAFRECRGLEIATVHGRGYRVRLDETAPAGADATMAPLQAVQRRALVGRVREMHALREAFEAALRGERQIVFIGGTPGIGKTALVDALASRIDQWAELGGAPAGVWVGRARCLPVSGAAEPLRPVLAALAGIQPPQAIASVSALLSRFAPHLLDEADVVPCDPTPVRPESMPETLAAQLEALSAARPVVLILEDLHWADVQTCALLAALFQRATRCHLFVLATYRDGDVASRDHPLATVLRELSLTASSRARALGLETLGRAEVAELVDGYLGPAPDTLAAFLFERSGGNPLFVDRLLAHLQGSGALQRRDDGWDFAEERTRSAVPEDLEHFIASQLEQLEREYRRVLQAAAVAGSTFMTQDVAAVLGIGIEQVDAICEDLANKHHLLDIAGVKSRSDGVVGTEYQFRHPLVQNVLYDRLPAVYRQAFHARLAAQLETSYGEQAVLNAHELAHHFERGGVPERTLHYLRVAAHVAVRRGMLADARTYLRDVVQMLETAPASGARLDVDTELARLMIICSGPTPETSAAVGRALERQQSNLDAGAGRAAAAIPTFMLFAMHAVEGDFHQAYEVGLLLTLCQKRSPE